MSNIWIIDDRPWSLLSEQEKKERFDAVWDSYTEEERRMIEDGVKASMAKSNEQN